MEAVAVIKKDGDDLFFLGDGKFKLKKQKSR